MGGTTLLLVAGIDTAWLGADTKLSVRTDFTRIAMTSKISIVDHFYFMFGGKLELKKEGVIQLDVIKELTEFASKNKSEQKIKDFINGALRQKFETLINQIPNDQFARMFPDVRSLYAVQIYLIYFSGHSPGCFSFSFKINPNTKKVESNEAALPAAQTNRPFRAFDWGFADHMENKFNEGFRLTPSRMKDDIQYLIGLEAAMHPEAVGGKIEVLQVYKNGYKWLSKM